MGKGDMKTKKGKIFRGSYGVRRPRKKWKLKNRTLTKNPQENASELQEKMSEIKVDKEKENSGKE
jgi:30S ribosomal protein S31